MRREMGAVGGRRGVLTELGQAVFVERSESLLLAHWRPRWAARKMPRRCVCACWMSTPASTALAVLNEVPFGAAVGGSR